MSPEEIIERVRYRQSTDRIHFNSDIDHLLAIHAAVVEMFEAKDAFATALFDETCSEDECNACETRLEKTRAKLADLCGWKEEGGA